MPTVGYLYMGTYGPKSIGHPTEELALGPKCFSAQRQIRTIQILSSYREIQVWDGLGKNSERGCKCCSAGSALEYRVPGFDPHELISVIGEIEGRDPCTDGKETEDAPCHADPKCPLLKYRAVEILHTSSKPNAIPE